MTTLTEYTATHFPNHLTDETTGDNTLTDHTAVAHVVGADNGRELTRRMQRALPNVDIGTTVVRPTEATVIPAGKEDTEGVVDLPHRRVAGAGLAGGVLVGAAVGVIVGLVTDSWIVGLIVGVFAAILGGTVSAIAGGGARYGGERAWEQPHVPEHTIAVVAAFATSETDALAAAKLMEEMHPYEVRIVAADGAWHSPNTWSSTD